MSFLVLALAIASGVSGTLLTRASRGFSRWRYAGGAVLGYAAATICMAWLVQHLPIGVVYAVWTGTAAAILVGVDCFVFGVKTTRFGLLGMALTLAGVALLATVIA